MANKYIKMFNIVSHDGKCKSNSNDIPFHTQVMLTGKSNTQMLVRMYRSWNPAY